MSEVPSVGAWIVPADLKHLNRKIDRARSAIERARKITTAPQQTPGPLVAGASNYSMGKKLAAENNRRAVAFCAQLQAEADLAHYTWVRDGYIQGANWPNGQRRVPGRVESRAVAHLRQVAKSEARGWDSRKVYRDISIDGLSKLADGRVVYLDINFDSGPGGYRIRVEHPDKTVLYGAFCSSIAKLKDSGTLKALLDQSTVTPELPILVLA